MKFDHKVTSGEIDFDVITLHPKPQDKLYGCHSKRVTGRLQHDTVKGKGNSEGAYVFSRTCQYQLEVKDDVQCKGCAELKK